jgi:hypothetical protein
MEATSMTYLTRLTTLLALLGISCVAAADSNRFESPTAGIAFLKPESWHFVSMQSTLENREKVRLDDAELDKQMKAQANPPLAVVMKHAEPYPDINPSFQVGLRPLGTLQGKSAKELVEVVLSGMSKMFADFKVVSPATETEVGGLPAARASIHYTLNTTDGDAYPTWSDMVVVPRGKFMFFVGMGRKQGDELATAELEQTLSSIEIQP